MTRATFTQLNSDEVFTECARCGEPLPQDCKYICNVCDMQVIELQSRFRSEEEKQERVALYRAAGIPFDMVRLKIAPSVHGPLLRWARGDSGYVVHMVDGHDVVSTTANRRWDLGAAMYQRIRESRRVNGARIIYAERLVTLEFAQLDALMEEMMLVQLLAIDFPDGTVIPDHVMTRLFALVSTRHWTGHRPNPTLIGCGGDVNHTLQQIVDLISAPSLATGEVAEPEAHAEVPYGLFEQVCFDCGKTVHSKHASSRSWICPTCAKGGK